MKLFAKAAAAAVVLTAGSVAAPASASVVVNFAQYQQQNAGDTLRWTQSAAKTGGVLQDIGDPTVIFRLWDTAVEPGEVVQVLAKMQFDAKVDDGTPALTIAGQQYQSGLHGTFSFTALEAFSRNGVDYGIGTDLLSGAFSGGTILGVSTGSVNVDPMDTGVAAFTSGVFDTSHFFDETFSLGLNAITRSSGVTGLAHLNGKSLSNFTATSTGQFAAAAVPEPATWGLMILGFGGAGMLLRRRAVIARRSFGMTAAG
jgi:hypothetical protein